VINPANQPPATPGARPARKPRSLAEETRAILRDFRLQPKQSLGQHFLIDREALDFIAAAEALHPGDQVLEIGPGIGTLTLALAATGASVHAIELDQAMARVATARTAGYTNVVIHEGNVLHTDLGLILPPGQPFVVIANIPYYITAPLLRVFLEGPYRPRALVLMVQREVGERLAARPGHMSALSVFTQVQAAVQILRIVPPSSFLPPPAVASSVLRLVVRDQPPVAPEDQPFMFRVVRAGFGSRRKMVHNALNHGLPNRTEVIYQALMQAGVARTRRAETLSFGEWQAISQSLSRDPEHRPRCRAMPGEPGRDTATE
jgi:16S rRNA (adenine1518-N6/adenine1519-N6)-dimethyltransferase